MSKEKIAKALKTTDKIVVNEEYPVVDHNANKENCIVIQKANGYIDAVNASDVRITEK